MEEQAAAGDIVQVIDLMHPWYPALLVVSEVKSWGVVAYCLVPDSNMKGPASCAYNRLEWSKVDKVGTAKVLAE